MQECIAIHYLYIYRKVNGYIQTQLVVVQPVANIHNLAGGVLLVKILFNKLMKFSKHREVQHCPTGSPQHLRISPAMAPYGSGTFSEELVKAIPICQHRGRLKTRVQMQELPNVRKLKIWVPMS